MKLVVLFGTETGNAELVAEDIVDAVRAETEASAHDMADFDIAGLTPDALYLIVCSTYGDGELPNSAQPFANALREQRPDLSGVRFAVFGLGDSFYATYNQGSRLLAELLGELGARQVGEHGLHDASSSELPGDVALAWAKSILSQL